MPHGTILISKQPTEKYNKYPRNQGEYFPIDIFYKKGKAPQAVYIFNSL